MPIRLNGANQESTINQQSASPIGTYHLADNPNLYEIQRTNNFAFVVTDLDGIRRAGTLGNETNATIPNAQEVISLSVTSCPIPHFSQEPIEIRRGNSTMKFAGVPKFGSGQIKLVDYIGAGTKDVLAAWQNLSYNVQTEKVGLVSDYKKDCYLIEYTPDYQKVRQFKLHGCWISELSEDEYNYDSNEKHLITATIEYDRAEIDSTEVY